MTDLLPSPDTTAILLAIALAWWSLRRLIVQRNEADAGEVDFNKALDAVRQNMANTMGEVAGATRAPTIGELEKLLNSEPDAKVSITPDGKVVVDAQDRK